MLKFASGISRLLQDLDDRGATGTTDVVGQTQTKVLVRDLVFTGVAPELVPYFLQLCQACRAHGMPLGLQVRRRR